MNRLHTVAIVGIEAIPVTVEIELVKTIPSFVIVGMANRAISESKERIRAVFNSCGLNFPMGKIIVNLSPADIIKDGSHFDLPIIIGLLQSMKVIKETHDNTIFFGELSLNGDFLKTKGLLTTALYCYRHDKKIVIHENYYQEMVNIFREKSHLIEVYNNLMDFIHDKKKILIHEKISNDDKEDKSWIFQDILGHGIAKRAAAIGLIGRHNILFFGPPGSGKSLISKSLQNFNLWLSNEDRLTVSSIYSNAGLLNDNQLINNEPFRQPHNTISYASLLGGGQFFKPGEISLAHKGLLFLDELAEFNMDILDMLRQVMEDKSVIIGRAQYNIKMPADFQLIATMNPCKCGYFGDLKKPCICSPHRIQKYQKKNSGPLMDRIDMRIFMGNNYENDDNKINYYDMVIQGRNFMAGRIQKIYENHGVIIANNNIQLQNLVLLNYNENTLKIIDEFVKINNISLRRKLKILSVARTIADLEQKDEVEENHGLEAIFLTSKMMY